MQVKVLTLPFSESIAGFPDEVVRRFAIDKHIHEVSDHFFTRDGRPYLTLVLKYSSPGEPGLQVRTATAREPAEEPTARLREVDFPVFKALKGWRVERARKDGVPPYVVATNRQLAEIAASRPSSKAALGTIPGIGEGKVARYGDDILALVPSAVAVSARTGDPHTEGLVASTSREETQ